MADLDKLRPEVRGRGPCKVCGATGYALSYGGPDICPACDCGIKPDVSRLTRELANARAELVRLAGVERQFDEVCSLWTRDKTAAVRYLDRAEKAEAELKAAHAEMDQLRADAETGKAWRTNSSLEEWFPITAAELKHVKAKLAALKARIAEAPVGVFGLCYNGHEPGFLGFPQAIDNLPRESMLGKRVRLVVEE